MSDFRANEPPCDSLLTRYQLLVELSQGLSSTLELKSLLNKIVQAAADLCQAQGASILLYDRRRQELYFSAASNMDEPLRESLKVPLEGSIAGWIVQHQEPVLISDTQTDPRHSENVDQFTHISTQSLLGVPLIAKDTVIGVLEAINKRDGSFTSDDQELLMALAGQAALAVETARLFQQSDVISDMVHELRTPLTSLNTAVRLLEHPQVTLEMRASIIQMILRETERLNEMVSEFLDLARLESGRVQFQTQPVNLQSLVEESVALMQPQAQASGLALTLEPPPSLPAVPGDSDKLKQVVLNLLSNAVKYNQAGGKIWVRLVQVNGGEQMIEVGDTGPGIPPESLPRLFEKFYRVPGTESMATGTGLGLAICKQIVEAHRGRIEVSSQVEQGSQFRVILPGVQ